MKVNGKTISNTDSVRRFGPITVNMKVITQKVKNMVRVYISGKMAPCTTETGLKTELKDTVNTNGKTAECTLDNGKIIICMVKEFTLGPMVEDMKASMKWTKNMDLVSTSGQMVEFTKETGLMENNMAKANIYYKIKL